MTLAGDKFQAFDTADDVVRFSITVRDVRWFKEALVEALLTLTRRENYALNGTATGDDVEDYGSEAFNSLKIAGDAMTIGTIVDWIGDIETAPEEWLYCDGSEYSLAEYPDLFDVMPEALRTDETHFIVPDLRAHSTVGAGVYDDHDAIYIEVGQSERFGYDQSFGIHYHIIPAEVVNIQLGATAKRLLLSSPGNPDDIHSGSYGADPAYRTNYHPSFGLHKFIVAL